MYCRPGDTVRFLAFAQIAASGLGKTGLTVTISINEGTTNRVTVASATAMTAVDATNQPGLYYYDFAVTSTWFGTIVAQGTTSDTTCIVRSLEMLYISVPWLPITASGTASAGASTAITMAGASATDNIYNGQMVMILAGTGAGQSRVITGYVGSTKVATVTPAWATTPDNTSVFTTQPLGANVAAMNLIAATPITTINANQGTTQPVNFTGTGASALAKSDAVDIAGAAVSTSSAQIGVNAVNWAGGAIPAPAVTGVPKIDLTYILGTILTETAGLIAAGFKKFFNIASPTSTMNQITLVDTVTTATIATNLTNAPTVGDFTATMKNSLNAASVTVSDKTGFSLSAAGIQAIWDRATSALTTAGSIGKLFVDNINATIASRSTLTAADVWDALTSGITTSGSIGKLLVDNVNAAIGSVPTAVWASGTRTLTSLTALASDIAGAVWNAMAASYNTALTMGEKLNNAGGAANPWTTLISGVTFASGTAGYLQNLLSAILAKVTPIGNGVLIVQAPVAVDGLTRLTSGSSYTNADGNALVYTVTGYPDFDIGAPAYWHATNKSGGATKITGIVTAIGELTFEVAAAQSRKLKTGVYALYTTSDNDNPLVMPNNTLVVDEAI